MQAFAERASKKTYKLIADDLKKKVIRYASRGKGGGENREYRVSITALIIDQSIECLAQTSIYQARF